MKFSRAISFSVLAFPLLATAIALPGGEPPPPPPSCSAGTGALTCCDSIQAVGSLTGPVKTLLGLLHINIGNLQGLVGLGCIPIVGAITCTQQTVCCTDNTFNSAVAIGCTNISL